MCEINRKHVLKTLDGHLVEDPFQVVLSLWFLEVRTIYGWYMAVKSHWQMHKGELHVLRIISPKGRPPDDI